MDLKKLREKNILQTKEKVKESVSYDQLIINSINTIEELEKIINSLAMRLRDWFCLINPELENQIKDNEVLIKKIISQKLDETEMGAKLNKIDEQQIINLSKQIQELIKYQKELEKYLEEIQEKHIPNVQDLAGTMIAAKLLREVKSLRKLALLQSGTTQLLGAESALFRHIKTGARPPKYGFIVNHPVVQDSNQKGKAARNLADKLSIAARLDYFKGERLGKQYLEELKEKWKK